MEKKSIQNEVRIVVPQLEEVMRTRGWSEPILAAKLGINYSYLYRVLRYQRNPGIKFLMGLLEFCKEEDIDIYSFVNF